jgi:hypothetical protein
MAWEGQEHHTYEDLRLDLRTVLKLDLEEIRYEDMEWIELFLDGIQWKDCLITAVQISPRKGSSLSHK